MNPPNSLRHESQDHNSERLDDQSLNRLFRHARTHRAWQQRGIPMPLLHELYSLMVQGPTSANCLPARIIFLCSAEAKERLLPLMAAGNREQTRLAPVTAIVGYDLRFYEQLFKLYPHQPEASSWFSATPVTARETALRNGSLQGGYLILAARALGLDCGPMGGFDGEAAAREFFPGKPCEVNFICNLGYGMPARLHPPLPRLAFNEACAIV
ncbi:malonic semialdehyde reductase [Paralcaligenes sp. KSB-10]|jgi:nitroreductase|uniref:malonic semialdehyde reductase n=1 Tax=Paralcaligenes sp. KSB-10 TaxID=2901142 RepID=UPI001E48DF53|nr:malonic semialdehyde reductase [Paralcaligenes sp. KSB-10]UHL64386.1 malonic semialdehyde reductase [Paralcaligenes sp. KSB-10]